MTGDGARRARTLAVIAALLVGGVAVDLLIDRPRVAPREAATGAVEHQVPLAPSERAGSSAWFCTGATAAPNGVADGTVAVANAGSRRLEGSVTVMTGSPQPRTVPLAVEPRSRAALRLGEVLSGPWASAIVELDGGGAVVELSTEGPFGGGVTPCTSSASDSWFFAAGATTRDASQTLVAFNPFPEDAVIDVQFVSDEGAVSPEDLTGVAVAGRGMLVIDVGQFVPRRESVAATIRARNGRLVAARVQTHDGSAGPRGMSVSIGAAAPGMLWHFPEGVLPEGGAERLSLYNPGAADADLEVTFLLDAGEAEPLALNVPAHSLLVLRASDETRVPRGVGHAVTVRATGRAGVVAERTISAGAGERTGVSTALGGRLPAKRWATAVGRADDVVDEWVVVHNPGAEPVRASVAVLVDGEERRPPGLQELEIGARGRRALRLSEHVGLAVAPVVVTATEPVVVERDLYRRRGPGMAMALAVPLR
jgi:hypothetical protein